MAASFIGWVLATCTADPSPVDANNTELQSPNMEAITILFRAICFSRFFSRYHALIPITTTAASTKPEVTVWKNLLIATGENSTSQKEVISCRAVSGLKVVPTGYCIHALATRIHNAERLAPMAVSHVEARWKPRDTRFHPKNMTAKKVLSRKKAIIPSIANGAPKISPTK